MTRRHFLATTAAATAAAASSSSVSAASGEKLRVAVIGHTGRGAYGHGLDTMWLKLPETEIVAVADADAKGLTGAVGKLGLKADQGFSDYEAMLASAKADIVAIGPRHVDQHRDMLIAAIEAGAKGVYIEKPFVRTLAEADEVLAAAKAKGVKISIAHRNRFHPVLPVVQKLVADGALGQVLEMRGRGKEDARGGGLDLWVLGTHVMNLACYFGGKPLDCSAVVLQDGKPVTKANVAEGAEGIGLLAGNEVHARYQMERGMPVYFDSIQNAGVKEAAFGLQIIGTKGIVDFRIDVEPLAHFLPGSPFQPVKTLRTWQPITTGGIGQPEPIVDLGKQVAGHLTAGADLIAAI
ncbi:MAG TPA: Gfo/Idh/MocA family oxidoreductase, partial [Verrucomicrobium sp.]|nr:Gfo/Idh/MocA family oxidoreductase [Verrucomicrobium sp.]